MSIPSIPKGGPVMNAERPQTEWLTQSQAAEYLGVTDRTIRNLIARGELQGYRFGKRHIRIKAEDLDAALKPIDAKWNSDPDTALVAALDAIEVN